MDIISAKMSVTADWNESQAVLGLIPSILLSGTDEDSLSFLIGSGSGLVDVIYFQQRTLAAGADETLDLADIPVADAESNFNVAFGFQHIKSIKIRIVDNDDEDETIAHSMKIGGAASNQWTGWLDPSTATETIHSDGVPYTKGSDRGQIVDGTHKDLKITNLDGTNQLTYQILVYGIKI